MAARNLGSPGSGREQIPPSHHNERSDFLPPRTYSQGFYSSRKKNCSDTLVKLFARSDKSDHCHMRTEIDRKETKIR